MSSSSTTPSSSSTSIQPGRIVQIHSLQSAAGNQLNGQRAVVLRHVPKDDRFEVILDHSDNPSNASKAIRPANLKVCERLPLPIPVDYDYSCSNFEASLSTFRGVATEPWSRHGHGHGGGSTNTCRKLCEMLLWYREDYRPPETMLAGYAGGCWQRLDPWTNCMHFVSCQMEQMGGVLALADICRKAGAISTSDVIFALLEGDVMYLETLAQTLYWTAYIGPEGNNPDDMDRLFNGPPTELTPDQAEDAYIIAMGLGPLLLLREASRYNKIGQALFAAFRTDCQFYHLLVQRLLRLMAMEALYPTGGNEHLGEMARSILQDGILGGEAIPISMSATAAHHIMDHAGEVLSSPKKVTNGAILQFLQRPDE